MRRVLVGMVLAVGVAAPAQAADIPDINCGIVSCTYAIEQKLDEVAAATEGTEACVRGGLRAIGQALQGTPQPAECSP